MKILEEVAILTVSSSGIPERNAREVILPAIRSIYVFNRVSDKVIFINRYKNSRYWNRSVLGVLV